MTSPPEFRHSIVPYALMFYNKNNNIIVCLPKKGGRKYLKTCHNHPNFLYPKVEQTHHFSQFFLGLHCCFRFNWEALRNLMVLYLFIACAHVYANREQIQEQAFFPLKKKSSSTDLTDWMYKRAIADLLNAFFQGKKNEEQQSQGKKKKLCNTITLKRQQIFLTK